MTFLQNSPHFTHHFLLRLFDNQDWLREGLLSCNSDEVRTVSGLHIFTSKPLRRLQCQISKCFDFQSVTFRMSAGRMFVCSTYLERNLESVVLLDG